MDKILSNVVLTPIEGGFNWQLDEQLQVQDDVLGIITIPRGFISDLGSIPRLFWNLIPPMGPATAGYLTHDWLYAKQLCSRYDADNCLLRLMNVLGVSWLSRYTVYWNLRAFGWVAWNEDSKKGMQVPS